MSVCWWYNFKNITPEGIINERPDADALLMTALDRCLHGKDILCALEASAPHRVLSSTETSS